MRPMLRIVYDIVDNCVGKLGNCSTAGDGFCYNALLPLNFGKSGARFG